MSDQSRAPVGAQPTANRRPEAPVAVTVWVVAAVLAIIAPFLDFVHVSAEGHFTEQISGWGQISVQSGTGLVKAGSGHGTMHGITLVTAALLLVAGVVAWLRRSSRWADLLGCVGSVAVVFAAAGAGLDEESVVSYSGSAERLSVQIGLWVALAAGVAGLVGAVLAARNLTRTV